MYDTTKPFKHAIREMVRETWDNPFMEVVDDGYYVEYREKHAGRVIDHTDGLGTKGVWHWMHRTFEAAGTDALAMNVNDLALVGATPYKAHVHLMLPQDDHPAILEIMEALCKLCKDRKIAITGGETAIHSNLKGMEISLNVSGVVTEDWRRPMVAQDGDKLVCIPSAGVHSNGFTLIGTLFEDIHRPWMIAPTRLYDRDILGKNLPVHAAMHITGGAWTKVKNILPKYGTACFEDWGVPECFDDIYNKYALMYDAGLFRKEWQPTELMYNTFNMGVGLVLAVPAGEAQAVARAVGGFVGGDVKVNEGGHEKQVVIQTKYGMVIYR